MDDSEQEYFVAGMHEALITELSKIRALKVISRTSVMRYRERKPPIPEIADELGVEALIEGSVLRAGNQVRITAQLIHGTTDEHLWAESYFLLLRIHRKPRLAPVLKVLTLLIQILKLRVAVRMRRPFARSSGALAGCSPAFPAGSYRRSWH